jgi:SPP1 family predicted phage head-tail adaptor
MNIGQMDRKITIQRKSSSTVDAAGSPVESWSTHWRTWAKFVPMSGSESLRIERQVGSEIARFFVRFYDDITIKDRISFDGKLWDIQNIRELGRRESLEILAEALK